MLVFPALSSCYGKPGEYADLESKDDLQSDESDESLSVVECSETIFPSDGDPCSEADHADGIRCRPCSCGASCCDTCECGTDLRWSCGMECNDTYLDGGAERCYYGTPPRCLNRCIPLPEGPDGTEDEDGSTADIPDIALDTVVDAWPDVPDGCGQVIPSVISTAREWCAGQFPDSCLDHGCGPCQVCYVDITAPPLDNADAPIYGCEGDGLCHDLCATDSDCAEDEECLNIGWWNCHDVPSACLRMCWSRAYPPDLICP